MPMRYCARKFADAEIERIRKIITEEPRRSRAEISRVVCEQLGWYKPDGGLKQMSCRVALLRMQADGLIELPPPRNGNGNQKPYNRRSEATEPQLPLCNTVGALTDLQLNPVSSRAQSHLWNQYIDRYHYLGYKPLPGAQLRYLATSQGQILALLGFAAAAWKAAPRDRFIGWSHETRQKNLHLVLNNARFLILPWIRSKNLASKLLSLVSKRIAQDWSHRYHYRPVLMETFVESQRFHGTCYKAANWIHVGDTKGRGKLDVHNRAALPVKQIYLYPLTKEFKRILCS